MPFAAAPVTRMAVQPRRPDFIGIGAHKSASTWLWHWLEQHPQIAPGDKERHFWDRVYPDEPAKAYCLRFAGVPAGQLAGEITPAYAILPPETIAAVYALLPEAKILFQMRNPIERSWSNARFHGKLVGEDFAGYDEAKMIETLQADRCLWRSDYEACLRNWLTRYARDQLFVARYDRIAEDPVALMRDYALFLGIDPDFYARPALRGQLETKINESPPAAMPDAVRAYLLEFYRPRIERLGAFLGLDLSPWWQAYEAPAVLNG